MTQVRFKQKRYDDWMTLLYLVFFTSIFFSFRALTSISVAILIVSGIILNKLETGSWLNKKILNLFALSCFLFYLFQFAGLLYTNDPSQQLSSLRLKSSLIFIPFTLCCCEFLHLKTLRRVMTGYCLLLVITAFYCLVTNLFKFSGHHDAGVFFYHRLVSPVSQHAIQFSVLTIVALYYLWENWNQERFVFNRVAHILFIGFFSLFLFLLSSKLLIIVYLGYLVYFFISFFRKRAAMRWMLPAVFAALFLVVSILFLTKNPVSRRFNEIIKGNITVVSQERFAPGDYFNGLQFRLLQWRFVADVLTKDHAWLVGVTAGDAQEKLDQEYVSRNMYVGETHRHDHGFLGYNTHNQFLESLLQGGVVEGLLFLLVCFSLIRMAWIAKQRLISFAIITILLYSFSESVFETQYSLTIFLLFPLIFRMAKPSHP